MIYRSCLLALFTLSIFTCEAKVATRYGDNFKNEQEVRNAFWKYWITVDRVTSKTYPDLYAKIEEQSKKIGIKAPYAFVYKGDSFGGRNNAFAVIGGVVALMTKPFGGLICVGSHLLEKMTEEELNFIISHELGHLKAKQIAAMNLVVLPLVVTANSVNMLKYVYIFRNYKNNNALCIETNDFIKNCLTIFLCSLTGEAALSIIVNKCSRMLEKDADLTAIKATRDVDAGCSGLRKLGARYDKMFPCATYKHKFWNKLTFGLFRSHPCIEERCRYMQEAQNNLEVVTDYLK